MATIKETYASNIKLNILKDGDILDKSGNSNDGTLSGANFHWKHTPKGYGLQFMYPSADNVTISEVADLQVQSNFSIAFWWWHDQVPAAFNPRIIHKYDDGSNDYSVVSRGSGNSAMAFTVTESGTSYSTKASSAQDLNKWYHYVLTYTSGVDPVVYRNGVDVSTVSADWATSSTTSDLIIGRLGTTGLMIPGSLMDIVFFSGVTLSAAEATQLYEEVTQEARILKMPKRNFRMPQVIGNSEFTRDELWTKGTGWTIADGKASCSGAQSAASDLSQAVGVVGKDYTIEYSISNYSAGNITGLAGDATGTNRAANGVYVDFITSTSDTDIGLQADTDFVGDIDWVRVNEGPKLVYKETFEDAPDTVTAIGSGFLGSVRIESGTFKVSNDGTDKWLECATAGAGSVSLLNAYGTWQFDIYKGGETTQPIFVFAADTAGAETATGQDAYSIFFVSTEDIFTREITNGSASNINKTAASYIAIQTKYSVRVTRDFSGAFNAYIKGGAFTSWTSIDFSVQGSNPWTDTTKTSGQYLNFDLDATDKITGIKYWHGVLDTTNYPNL